MWVKFLHFYDYSDILCFDVLSVLLSMIINLLYPSSLLIRIIYRLRRKPIFLCNIVCFKGYRISNQFLQYQVFELLIWASLPVRHSKISGLWSKHADFFMRLNLKWKRCLQPLETSMILHSLKPHCQRFGYSQSPFSTLITYPSPLSSIKMSSQTMDLPQNRSRSANEKIWLPAIRSRTRYDPLMVDWKRPKLTG